MVLFVVVPLSLTGSRRLQAMNKCNHSTEVIRSEIIMCDHMISCDVSLDRYHCVQFR